MNHQQSLLPSLTRVAGSAAGQQHPMLQWLGSAATESNLSQIQSSCPPLVAGYCSGRSGRESTLSPEALKRRRWNRPFSVTTMSALLVLGCEICRTLCRSPRSFVTLAFNLEDLETSLDYQTAKEKQCYRYFIMMHSQYILVLGSGVWPRGKLRKTVGMQGSGAKFHISSSHLWKFHPHT
ncbi:hypothetical protein EK904_009707 [Melospiza melodia maxima]|nr:hypothetical protein EK904_009707 [Melospiza melodia maxima]